MNFKLSAFADEAGKNIGEQIEALRENGIEYLEIRGVDGQNISAITNEKAKEVKRQLDDAGIAVWSLGSPYGKINIDGDFDGHLDSFKHGLELADILGTQRIRMFSFYVPAGSEAIYRDDVLEKLERMIDTAKGSGIILCHENEKGIYGATASGCAEIHKAFPTLRAVFDPANFIQCKQDTVKAWDMLSDYVDYMHIKDALENGSVVPAGKGIGNLPYLLERYRGEVLTLEPHLSVFSGFEQLEANEKTKMGYCYPTHRAAFDAAVNALKELI